MKGDMGKKLPSFWLPELCPSSEIKSKIDKPVNKCTKLMIVMV